METDGGDEQDHHRQQPHQTAFGRGNSDQGALPADVVRLAHKFTTFGKRVKPALEILLADAQTSGGLLLAENSKDLHEAQNLLLANGASVVCEIGTLSSSGDKVVVVSWEVR